MTGGRAAHRIAPYKGGATARKCVMAEHPNVELMRKLVDAFIRGDLETIRSHWADDIVYHVPGNNALAGDYKGEDGVLQYLTRIRDLTEGTLRIEEVHDLLASDEHGVLLHRIAAERSGRQFSWDQINVYHVRDGKIAEAWAHPADQGAVDRFFS